MAVVVASPQGPQILRFHAGDGPRDGLLVSDPRFAGAHPHPVLPLQAAHEHLQVQLTHARENDLTRVLVRAQAEGGVLFRERLERLLQLGLVRRGHWLHRHVDDRIRKNDGLQGDGMLHVAEGIARESLLETRHRRDVANTNLRQVLPAVGVHAHQSRDPLALVPPRVVDALAARQSPRVNPHVGKTAHVGIRHQLEYQGGERLVLAGRT